MLTHWLILVTCLNILTKEARCATATTKPTTTTKMSTLSNENELVYEYDEMSDNSRMIESVVLNNLTSATSSMTTNPRKNINETINNIEVYIPELQEEVSSTKKLDFTTCNGPICTDSCTHLKIDLLGIDSYS